MRIFKLSAFLLGSCLFTGCVSPEQPASAQQPRASLLHVKVGKIERHDMTRTIELVTHLRPYFEVTLYSRVTGYLHSLHVDRGSRVKKGDLLAVIAVPELQQDLRRWNAQVEMDQAQINQALADYHYQKQMVFRLESLWKKAPGATSRLRMDEAKGKMLIAKAQVAISRARRRVHLAQAKRLRAQLRFSRLRAPFAGVITHRHVAPGALILGNTKKQPLLSLVQSEKLRGIIDIPAPDAPFVRNGLPLQVSLDAQSQPLQTSVTRITGALGTDTRTLRVEYDVDNRDHRLYPGMYGRVELKIEQRKKVITVPRSWLITQKDKSFLFVVRNRTLQRIPVEIGVENQIQGQSMVEICKGLTGREAIVTAPNSSMASGLKVEVDS